MAFELRDEDMLAIDDSTEPVPRRVRALCWRLCAAGAKPFMPVPPAGHGEQLRSLDMFVDALLANGDMHRLERQFDVARQIMAGGMGVDEFKSLVRSMDTSSRCGAVWESQSAAYRCRTCAKNSTMAICAGCFKAADHDGHDYNRFLSNAGGACDCGDRGVMHERGFCPRHGAKPACPSGGDTERGESERRLRAACVPLFVLAKLLVAVVRHLRRNCRTLAAARGAGHIGDAGDKLWSAVAPAVELAHEYTEAGGPITSCVAAILMDRDVYRWAHQPADRGGRSSTDEPEMGLSEAEKLSSDLYSEDGASGSMLCRSTVDKERGIRLDEDSVADFLVARDSLYAPSPASDDADASVASPTYDCLLAELCFWLVRLAFPQRFVTFLLSMLPVDEYKDAFSIHYFAHYDGAANVLLRAGAALADSDDEGAGAQANHFTAEAVTNRWVHVSVQLLSASDMCHRLRHAFQLPMQRILLGALRRVVREFLRRSQLRCREIADIELDDERSSAPSQWTYKCAPPEALAHAKYWAIASDVTNLLGHKLEAETLLQDDAVFDVWMKIVRWAQGMDSQRRIWSGEARQRDERAFSYSFSAEAELCGRVAVCLYDALAPESEGGDADAGERMDTAAPAAEKRARSSIGDDNAMDVAQPQGEHALAADPAESPRHSADELCMKWIDRCVADLRRWLVELGMSSFPPDDIARQMSRFWVAFHLPMHRNLSLALATAARRGLCAPDIDNAQHLFQMALMHPLQMQVARSEVFLGMWVRNGAGMKYRFYFVVHPSFSTTIQDADLFFIRVCAAVLPPDWFVATVLERFWLSEYFAAEPAPAGSPPRSAEPSGGREPDKGAGECSLPVVCTKDGVRAEWMGGLLEGALRLLVTVLASEFLDPCVPLKTRLVAETVAILSAKDGTHSQVAKSVPTRSPNECVEVDALVNDTIAAVADFRAPTVSGKMSEGLYVLKSCSWRDRFDPALAHARSLGREYAESINRYTRAGGKHLFSSGPRVVAVWPPYRLPAADGLRADEGICRVLNSRSLHAALYLILYNRWRCGATCVNDEIVALAVHLFSVAILANLGRGRGDTAEDIMRTVELSCDGTHDGAAAASGGDAKSRGADVRWLAGIYAADSAPLNFATRLNFAQESAPAALRSNQSCISLLLRLYAAAAAEARLPEKQQLWPAPPSHKAGGNPDDFVKSLPGHGGALHFIDRALRLAAECHTTCRWEQERCCMEMMRSSGSSQQTAQGGRLRM